MEERVAACVRRYGLCDGTYAVVGTALVPLHHLPRSMSVRRVYVVRDHEL